MAYGETMQKLSPCGNGLVLDLLITACGAPRALLDAGCGRGERLAACAEALPEARCCGIDCDADNVRSARARCHGAEIVTGDVCALPWPDAVFDAALCECTLSLLDQPARCLSELHRVLRPGGVLLLSDLTGGAAPAQRICLSPEGAVRYLAGKVWTEAAAAAAGFRLRRYRDCREEYLTMAAQMILDGSCACLGAETADALRRNRAGYGMWILQKEETR